MGGHLSESMNQGGREMIGSQWRVLRRPDAQGAHDQSYSKLVNYFGNPASKFSLAYQSGLICDDSAGTKRILLAAGEAVNRDYVIHNRCSRSPARARFISCILHANASSSLPR